MPYGFTTVGRADVLRAYIDNRSLEMTLYYDVTDSLSDTATVSDITTEPAGSNYTRSSISASDISVITDGSTALIDIAAQPFDVTDSTQNIDSFTLIDSSGDLVHRGPIDTGDRTTEYIDLDQNTNLLLGGEPTALN